MFTEKELDLIAAAMGRQAWWLQSLDGIGANTAQQQSEVLACKAKAISLFLEAQKEAAARAKMVAEKVNADQVS